MVTLNATTTTAYGNLPINGYSHTGGGIGRVSEQVFTAARTDSYTFIDGSYYNYYCGVEASITRQSTSNGILIYVRWTGELDNLWDTTWNLQVEKSNVPIPWYIPLDPSVNFTRDASSANEFGNNRNGGVVTGGESWYGSENNATTLAMVDFWYYHNPTDIGVTDLTLPYKLYASKPTTITLYTNRTVNNTSTPATGERGTSRIILMEIVR